MGFERPELSFQELAYIDLVRFQLDGLKRNSMVWCCFCAHDVDLLQIVRKTIDNMLYRSIVSYFCKVKALVILFFKPINALKQTQVGVKNGYWRK